MSIRTVFPSIALPALLVALAATPAPAAELELAPMHPHRAVHVRHTTYVRTGLVFWDSVYPPAIYGPQLRPIEEVVAMKAEARPVSQRWWGYWYVR